MRVFLIMPHLAKLGETGRASEKFGFFSDTLPVIQVSFCSPGAEMAEKQKAHMEYSSQKKTSERLNLNYCSVHNRTPQDETALNRGRHSEGGFPKVQRG